MEEHVLNKIFKENLKYLPRWHGALANHVSMAAVALFTMKERAHIDDAKIEKEAKVYSKNLTPIRNNSSSIDLKQIDWKIQKSLLGHDEYYESWKNFFLEEFESRNINELIAKWLERLGHGISAAAGHSVIRLAYAFKAKDYLQKEVYLEEIATCLADYASRYFPLSNHQVEPIAHQKISLDKYILEHKPLSNENLRLLDSCRLIEDKFFVCRNFSEFHDALSRVNTQINFKKIFDGLSTIAVANPNFALLHCITLGDAILFLSENLPVFNKTSVHQGYRDFVIAALLCNNLTVRSFEQKNVSIEQVYEAVNILNNDHKQKIVFTLTELYKRYSSPVYLEAALSYIG